MVEAICVVSGIRSEVRWQFYELRGMLSFQEDTPWTVNWFGWLGKNLILEWV